MTRKEIGTAIKKKRKERQMSYYKLAKLSGVTIQQIKSVETSTKSYTLDTLLSIAFALEYRVELR